MPSMQSLIDRLGSDVSVPDSEAALFTSDLFPSGKAVAPVAVLRPTHSDMVQEIARWTSAEGLALIARGGGVSYTGGYEPRTQKSVLLDLSQLNTVREINTADRYMIVDAGCTWEAVKIALEGTGLRPVLRGPISGSISTVGGAASQNLPGSMDGILGLEIVMPNGDLVTTGSGSLKDHSAFYRNFGPDFTGLFLGDAGTLGVKTAISLRLEPVPAGVAFASFGFATMTETVNVMTELASLNLGGRVFALDPLKNKTSTKVGVKEGLGTLKDVVKTGGLKRGLADAAKIAMAGQNAYDAVPWSLHLTFEGATQAVADALVAEAVAVCKKQGRQIDPSIPVAMNARSFSIRGFLGMKGERWVPLHGLFPLSKAEQAVAATEALFERHASALQENEIVHSFMMSANGPYLLIEPMFYWPDELLEIHKRNLPEHKLQKLTKFEPNPDAREVVTEIRTELRDLYFELGAVSAQIGKFYPYRDVLKDGTRQLFDQIKSCLDPDHSLNPGALQTRET